VVTPQVDLRLGPAKTHLGSPPTFYSNKIEVNFSNYDISIIFSEEGGGGDLGKEQEIRARIVLPHLVSAQLAGQLAFTTKLLEKLYGARIPGLMDPRDTPEQAADKMRAAISSVQQEMIDENAKAISMATMAAESSTSEGTTPGESLDIKIP